MAYAKTTTVDESRTKGRETDVGAGSGKRAGMTREMPPPFILHRDNIVWVDAPLPRRWHRCREWTIGFVGLGGYVERCACGAIRLGRSGPWMEKNSRRKNERRNKS